MGGPQKNIDVRRLRLTQFFIRPRIERPGHVHVVIRRHQPLDRLPLVLGGIGARSFLGREESGKLFAEFLWVGFVAPAGEAGVPRRRVAIRLQRLGFRLLVALAFEKELLIQVGNEPVKLVRHQEFAVFFQVFDADLFRGMLPVHELKQMEQVERDDKLFGTQPGGVPQDDIVFLPLHHGRILNIAKRGVGFRIVALLCHALSYRSGSIVVRGSLRTKWRLYGPAFSSRKAGLGKSPAVGLRYANPTNGALVCHPRPRSGIQCLCFFLCSKDKDTGFSLIAWIPDQVGDKRRG